MKCGFTHRMVATAAAIALCSCLLAPAALMAQEQQPITTITVAKVKLDKVAEFERLLKDEWIPGMKKAGIPWMSGWQADALGPAGTYIFASPIPNFATYDAPHPVAKVMGESKFAALVEGLRACMLSLDRHALDMDMSVSTIPEGSPSVAVYVQARVLPGKDAAVRQFLSHEVAPAMKKAGMKGFLVHYERFGTRPGLHMVVFSDNYAALDKGHPFIQAHGPEKGMALIHTSTTLIELQSVYPIRYMPALSFGEE